MARELKPLTVETFVDPKRRVTVELKLDRNTKEFFAEVQLERVCAPSIDELRGLVRKKIEQWTPLEWRKVIELHVDEPTNFGWRSGRARDTKTGKLEFEFGRYEVAEGMNGKLMERPFAEDLDDDEDRERQDKFPLAFADAFSDWKKDRQIPFTEEAWATLLELQAATTRAREKLKELFDPKDGGRRLVALGGLPAVPLLGAGPLHSAKKRGTTGSRENGE